MDCSFKTIIFLPPKSFCCRQRESIAFSSAANLLFSFFLDGLKFYAGHILLYSRSWMSSPDWICLTSQPNINRRAATQQISTRLAKLTELIYSNLYDWLSVFFLSFVCVCVYDSRDSVSPRRRTVIQSRLGAIKLTRYVYPIDIIYPRQQHTHTQKNGLTRAENNSNRGRSFIFPCIVSYQRAWHRLNWIYI